ncbi:hypothetical protein E6C60_1718 [Paenibacillus algicola]|uniref:Uncharacterized protein n=1 Tax=Paenibacillus algicola TaxID=2565926 RepID=A0A4P8XJJ1_9BACL|nr:MULTISPECIES: hypothetical protein [Paenibacillus]QCT02433.1 hypothetical protein E6C60_1718 [Paenibacillus algicola]
MNPFANLPHIRYCKKEAAELEQAAVVLQRIFDKTLHLLHLYLPESLWCAATGLTRKTEKDVFSEQLNNQVILQKWIQSPKGWKCVGMEPLEGEKGQSESILPSADPQEQETAFGGLEGRATGRLLQMVIWSQYEKIALLHPFLGGEAFYTAEELDTVSAYLAPTYLSPQPLQEVGKEYKVKSLSAGVPIYQEKIPAPTLVMDAGGRRLAGLWMTGVHLSAGGFAGIKPYLKVPQGERTYMNASFT